MKINQDALESVLKPNDFLLDTIADMLLNRRAVKLESNADILGSIAIYVAMVICSNPETATVKCSDEDLADFMNKNDSFMKKITKDLITKAVFKHAYEKRD